MKTLQHLLTPTKTLILLRLSLAVIFLWFGLLKFFGYDPVYDIINSTYPWLATDMGNMILGAFETLIGLGLLFNIWPKIVHVILVIHMSGTLLTFFISPELMFDPHFPILSLAGEFVFKNILLVSAGLVILAHELKGERSL